MDGRWRWPERRLGPTNRATIDHEVCIASEAIRAQACKQCASAALGNPASIALSWRPSGARGRRSALREMRRLHRASFARAQEPMIHRTNEALRTRFDENRLWRSPHACSHTSIVLFY
jgi:hypothetical protein